MPSRDYLGVFCLENALIIDELIPVNKKAMTGSEFMRGYLKS